jgi:hypothetical protein|tara:strand:- start:985 stop:1488 length:504 start_codon:yes stop_codon:yes gene_type:complete
MMNDVLTQGYNGPPNTVAIKALIAAQQGMNSVKKDSVNPHFKNKYASLEAVIEATSKVFQSNGFAVMQPCGRDDLGVFVETMLLHTSGESFSSRVYLALSKQDMQGLGSAITYARRYGLLGMACLAPEDDDGNDASKQSHGVKVTKGLTSTDESRSSPALPNEKPVW